MTPGTLSKSASTHQKQPPAKIAVAVLGACADAPAKETVAAASRQAAANSRPIMSATSQVVLCSPADSIDHPDRNGGQLLSQSCEAGVMIALPLLLAGPSVRRNLEPERACVSKAPRHMWRPTISRSR